MQVLKYCNEGSLVAQFQARPSNEISEGEIYIGERLVNNVLPKDRDIAMVFQNYALYPHMSAYDNLAFGLRMRRIPRAEIDRRVREAAQILQIEELLKRKPKALSGGQRQRVALGRAIVREPKVFLLDEPLSNLNAKLRAQTRTELIKLHQRLGTTFIYVTHDQTEAMTMANRIVVLKDGMIQQIDTPQELYERPKNLFVAGFIGTPQMNFIDAVLKLENGKLYLEFASLKFKLPDYAASSAKLKKYVGKTVIMGIRPEHFFKDAESLKNLSDYIIDATIDVAELMGAETYLYFTVDGNNIIARVPTGAVIQHGQKMKLAADINKIHLFDKETEQAINFR